MPDDLVPQVPVLKDVLGALRVATAEFPRYEADDVIASRAARAAARDVRTVVVTTDKDLLQLIDGKTSVWNPAKEMTVDAAGVKEFFGAEAAAVVDVLALWGDPSDNVPGVPGIGEKTAKALIREFGSLDNLLANLDKVKNARIREKLKVPENRDLLELSRRLVTVCRDLDVALDLDRYAVQPPDEQETVLSEESRRIREHPGGATLLLHAARPDPAGAAARLRPRGRRRSGSGPRPVPRAGWGGCGRRS
ncbi:MAG: hypothetical protein HGA94_04620 [Candidatus Aminicenantes bacterium]|nr:hypothetical protein [Candidatus Aminicenantes bacterium]